MISLSIIHNFGNFLQRPFLKTIPFTNGTEVETSYCGTVNDRGQRDGQGRLEYINYDISYEEGIWKNEFIESSEVSLTISTTDI